MIKVTDTCYVTSDNPDDENVEAVVCCENGRWIRINKKAEILKLLSDQEAMESIND